MARRLLDFDELEAWLRELPWWREWVRDIGGAVIGSGDVTGVHGLSGKPGSPTEREALNLMRIQQKVQLLDAWVGYLDDEGNVTGPGGRPPKLPGDLARLVHHRYMVKTATMGLPIDACCQVLHVSRRTFHQQRQRALSLLVTAIYTSSIDMGKPYSDCREEMVPRVARLGGLEAEIRRCEMEARECEKRASRAERSNTRNSREMIEHWRSETQRWQEQAEVLRKEMNQ